MQTLTRRHQAGLWIALGLAAILAVAAYVMTRPRSDPVPDLLQPSLPDRGPVKELPEYMELMSYYAQENQPLTPAVVVRAGELTTHHNFYVRIRALDLLGKAPEELKPYAATLVASRLKDEDGMVRQIAMNTLGTLGAKEYIPQIRELLNNPEDREGAKRVLKMLGPGSKRRLRTAPAPSASRRKTPPATPKWSLRDGNRGETCVRGADVGRIRRDRCGNRAEQIRHNCYLISFHRCAWS